MQYMSKGSLLLEILSFFSSQKEEHIKIEVLLKLKICGQVLNTVSVL